MNRCIVQSYSRPIPGGSVTVVGSLNCMAVDMHGHVMVTGWPHGRIELLSPTLTHLGYIQIPAYKLNGPCALHLDELNHRLYIG